MPFLQGEEALKGFLPPENTQGIFQWLFFLRQHPLGDLLGYLPEESGRVPEYKSPEKCGCLLKAPGVLTLKSVLTSLQQFLNITLEVFLPVYYSSDFSSGKQISDVTQWICLSLQISGQQFAL